LVAIQFPSDRHALKNLRELNFLANAKRNIATLRITPELRKLGTAAEIQLQACSRDETGLTNGLDP